MGNMVEVCFGKVVGVILIWYFSGIGFLWCFIFVYWKKICCFFIYVWFLLRFESFKKEYEVSDIEEVWFDLCNIVMFNNVWWKKNKN